MDTQKRQEQEQRDIDNLNLEIAKLEQARQEQKASITVAFEGRSQSEIWEERLAKIEARLDKLEGVRRKEQWCSVLKNG